MQERLGWMAKQPQSWCHWEAMRGGLQTHQAIAQRYPQARCYVVETAPVCQAAAQQQWQKPWWQMARWREQLPTLEHPPAGTLDMLWANMLLHRVADPAALLQQWQQLLAVDGFLMFSCLGPDTLRNLSQLYQALGWPAPQHALTDMHDWGDWLLLAGFDEPVMDMETISLSFASPQRLLQELRELGRNFHPQRWPHCRGRRWLAQLEQALDEHARLPDGQLGLQFEIVYGHAIKPPPRIAVGGESRVSLQDMRSLLRQGRKPAAPVA